MAKGNQKEVKQGELKEGEVKQKNPFAKPAKPVWVLGTGKANDQYAMYLYERKYVVPAIADILISNGEARLDENQNP